MITAVAFCPAAPLLVPALGGRAAPVRVLRDACRDAVRRAADGADRIVVVAPGPEWAAYPTGAVGSLAGYGVSGPSATVGLGAEPVPGAVPTMPAVLGVGASLLADTLGPDNGAAGVTRGPGPRTRGYEDWDELPSLRDPDLSVAVVALGEGSATGAAPASQDARGAAASHDRQLREAIRGGEGFRLQHALYDDTVRDPVRGAPLVDGMRAWSELAWDMQRDRPWHVDVDLDAAPFGVTYLVATWRREG